MGCPPHTERPHAGRTPRFFQFDTEYKIDDRTYVLRWRVWRSDFYQPKPVTFNATFAPAGNPEVAVVGVLRAMPLDKDKVRQIAEFFWWEETRDSAGEYVLRGPTLKEQDDLLIVSFPAALLERVKDIQGSRNSNFSGGGQNPGH